MTPDELKKLIRKEVVSTTNSQFKEFIEGDCFWKIIHNETRDAIQAEIGDRLL